MNDILWSLLFTLIIVQATKVLVHMMQGVPLRMQDYFTTGGMPSSHSAIMTSLTFGILLTEGWNSPLFALSIVLALLVMRDAIGVRRTVGELTLIMKKLAKKRITVHEAPGHTPQEVIIGAIVGAAITLIVFWF